MFDGQRGQMSIGHESARDEVLFEKLTQHVEQRLRAEVQRQLTRLRAYGLGAHFGTSLFAEYAGCHQNHVITLIQAKRLRAAQLGTKWTIADVDAAECMARAFIDADSKTLGF